MGAGFDFYFAAFLNQTGGVGDVPAEGGEESVEEIVAELGFHVAWVFVFGKILRERLDEADKLVPE